MFKRSYLVIASMALFGMLSPALGADITVKAPVRAAFASGDPCVVPTASTPLSCSGFYVGFGLAGQGSNADIIGSGINGSVFAGGMTPSLNAGYQYAKGSWLFAAEFDVGYAMGSAANINGSGSNVNGLRMTELVKLGGNLTGLLGVQQPITIPASLANTVLAPYVAVGQSQWQLSGAWANGTVGGAGVLFDISPQWFGDLRYTYTNFDKAKSQGITVNNDQALMISFNRKF